MKQKSQAVIETGSWYSDGRMEAGRVCGHWHRSPDAARRCIARTWGASPDAYYHGHVHDANGNRVQV